VFRHFDVEVNVYRQLSQSSVSSEFHSLHLFHLISKLITVFWIISVSCSRHAQVLLLLLSRKLHRCAVVVP